MSDPFEHDPLKDIEKMFHQQTLMERMKLITTGMKADKTSGEYKKAKLEVQRLLSPLAAVVVPILIVMVLVVVAKNTKPPDKKIEAKIVKEEVVPDLEEIQEEIIEPIEPPDPVDIEFEAIDMAFETEVEISNPTDSPSPSPADVDAVAIG